MPIEDAARPVTSISSAEALVLLLLATCSRQRQEIDRLTRERAELAEANRELVAERDELGQRNQELSRRVGLNSTNSSKPPSSDGLKRKRRTACSPERERRKRLGRKPGKQKGAPGHHLAMTSRPDRVVELLPAHCEKCSGSLVEHAGEAGMERRQVMDPPPPSGLETTEYRAISLRCAECGEVTKPAFPQWAKAPVQYGPRDARDGELPGSPPVHAVRADRGVRPRRLRGEGVGGHAGGDGEQGRAESAAGRG